MKSQDAVPNKNVKLDTKNLVRNGDFATGDFSGWKANEGFKHALTVAKYDGSYRAKAIGSRRQGSILNTDVIVDSGVYFVGFTCVAPDAGEDRGEELPINQPPFGWVFSTRIGNETHILGFGLVFIGREPETYHLEVHVPKGATFLNLNFSFGSDHFGLNGPNYFDNVSVFAVA